MADTSILTDAVAAYVAGMTDPEFQSFCAAVREPTDTAAAPPVDETETLDPKALAARITR